MTNYRNSEDDYLLVKKLSEDDILAFTTLFTKYANRLYHFAFSYFKSAEDSEELVQDVFTKVWVKRKDLKKELSFKSYLFTISFNLIKKHFRSKALIETYFTKADKTELDFHTSDSINSESLKEYIEEIVARFPDKQKEIFLRSRFKGQSIKDIALDMNLSHKTVENNITSALRLIRKMIEKENIVKSLFISLFIL